MLFSGYEKIADSVGAWGLDPAGYRALKRVRWAVTEKVHGANFCFVVEKGRVRGANRRHLLDDAEPFFGWQAVREWLKDGLRSVAANFPQAETVSVYGELFGGGYPHEDVAPMAGVAPVQTGVWYAPDVRFAAFDIAVEQEGVRRYVDFEQAGTVLQANGVPVVPVLFTGSFEKATDVSPRFDSKVPATLGLPPLPTGTNPAEGVVIRPLREIALPNGTRPVVKVKIPEFAEDKRFHEAQKWDVPAHHALGDPLDRLKWEAYNRVTENRLNATVSKIGTAPEKRDDVLDLLLDEVLTEARTADPDAWAMLNDAARTEWTAYVQGEVRALLQTRFG